MADGKQTGTIKWFSAEKGYGFIVPDSGAKDVFLHQQSLDRSGVVVAPKEGQKVSFETDERPKGLSAKNIMLL